MILYHGTSQPQVYKAWWDEFLKKPVYLTSDRQVAEHYAKAASAFVMDKLKMDKIEYSIVIVDSENLDSKKLKVDDYNLEKESNQYIYLDKIKLDECVIESESLEVSESELLSLQCFAIGMWRK